MTPRNATACALQAATAWARAGPLSIRRIGAELIGQDFQNEVRVAGADRIQWSALEPSARCCQPHACGGERPVPPREQLTNFGEQFLIGGGQVAELPVDVRFARQTG